MVGSWRPLISEVHGLAPHGQAVRSILVSEDFCGKEKSGPTDGVSQVRSDE
jgi:hypothetical protein